MPNIDGIHILWNINISLPCFICTSYHAWNVCDPFTFILPQSFTPWLERATGSLDFRLLVTTETHIGFITRINSFLLELDNQWFPPIPLGQHAWYPPRYCMTGCGVLIKSPAQVWDCLVARAQGSHSWAHVKEECSIVETSDILLTDWPHTPWKAAVKPFRLQELLIILFPLWNDTLPPFSSDIFICYKQELKDKILHSATNGVSSISPFHL